MGRLCHNLPEGFGTERRYKLHKRSCQVAKIGFHGGDIERILKSQPIIPHTISRSFEDQHKVRAQTKLR